MLYDGRGDIQKQNGPERLAWPESHMENGGSFAKESSRLNLQSGRASFPSSQRHGWRASEPETLEVLRVQMSKSQLAVLKLAGVQSDVNVLFTTTAVIQAIQNRVLPCTPACNQHLVLYCLKVADEPLVGQLTPLDLMGDENGWIVQATAMEDIIRNSTIHIKQQYEYRC